MQTFEKPSESADTLASDYLLIDLEAALALLKLAEDGSAREEARQRRFQAAVSAYDTIVKLLPSVALTEEQHEALMQRLTVLRQGLDRRVERCRKVA